MSAFPSSAAKITPSLTCNICTESVHDEASLPCGCQMHFPCLFRYARSVAASALVAAGGLRCPNRAVGSCAHPSCILSLDDLDALVDVACVPATSAYSDEPALTHEEVNKFRGWVAVASEPPVPIPEITVRFIDATTK